MMVYPTHLALATIFKKSEGNIGVMKLAVKSALQCLHNVRDVSPFLNQSLDLLQRMLWDHGAYLLVLNISYFSYHR
jgi:hypothetical protein